MIWIVKQNEPKSLEEHRNTPGSDYYGLDKTELRKSLLEEQGFICAYCMQRIRGADDTKIEHYQPRNPANELQYTNLLAVCYGNSKPNRQGVPIDPERFTCDKKKEDDILQINPQSEADMKTIYYDQNGRIYSTNEGYQKDLDEVLNLNDEYGYLIANRKSVLRPIKADLSRVKPGRSALPVLRKWERYCNSKNTAGEYAEYVGIMRWYIEKQLRKHLKP